MSVSEDGTRIVLGSWDRFLYSLDGEGSLLWKRKLGGAACDSLGQDGEFVVAGDSHGQVTCFDAEGQQLWSRDLGPFLLPENFAQTIVRENQALGEVPVFEPLEAGQAGNRFKLGLPKLPAVRDAEEEQRPDGDLP